MSAPKAALKGTLICREGGEGQRDRRAVRLQTRREIKRKSRRNLENCLLHSHFLNGFISKSPKRTASTPEVSHQPQYCRVINAGTCCHQAQSTETNPSPHSAGNSAAATRTGRTECYSKHGDGAAGQPRGALRTEGARLWLTLARKSPRKRPPFRPARPPESQPRHFCILT